MGKMEAAEKIGVTACHDFVEKTFVCVKAGVIRACCGVYGRVAFPEREYSNLFIRNPSTPKITQPRKECNA
jgi:hypothetical protein